MEAACAEPRLRALFPFPSHECLSFHRNTQFPWNNDLPFIAGSALSTVRGGRAGNGPPSPRLRASLRRVVAPSGSGTD
ncbi:hypothetical protein KNE206_41910 [Kitasatospora sp. NE20-6]